MGGYMGPPLQKIFILQSGKIDHGRLARSFKAKPSVAFYLP
jgi:hypothetical protein